MLKVSQPARMPDPKWENVARTDRMVNQSPAQRVEYEDMSSEVKSSIIGEMIPWSAWVTIPVWDCFARLNLVTHGEPPSFP